MANQKVQIQKTVYNNQQLSKVVNREFNYFGTPPVTESTDTVDKLFSLYDQLYLEIPVEGEINSHTYLIAKSSELVTVDADNELIQPLLEEITQLRTELLQANQEIASLNIKLANAAN